MNRTLLPLAIVLLVFGLGTLAFSQRPWAPRADVEQPIPLPASVALPTGTSLVLALRPEKLLLSAERPDGFALALKAAKKALDPRGILNPGVLIDPD